MEKKPSSPTFLMGYFDGRQIATETALGLLFRTLDERERGAIRELMRRVRRDFFAELQEPREFLRGFDECLERLDSLSEIAHKSHD